MQPQSSVFRHRARNNADSEAGGRGVVTDEAAAENDELMRALLSDVRAVRKKFTAMGDEVRRQNTLLDTLGDAFGRTRARLGRTLRQLDVAGVTSSVHMWVLFVFVVVFFMLIYVMMKLH